jgi:hypothetical protein
MEATTLFLANGMTRVVQGRAEDIGNTLKRRTMGQADDRLRQFTTIDGETLTVNADAVMLTEGATTTGDRAFGFARALGETR